MASTNDAKRRRTHGPDHVAARISPQQEQIVLRRKIETLRESLDASEVKGICKELTELLKDDDEIRQFIASGGVECLIDAMDDHATDLQVQMYACQALFIICVKEDISGLVLSNGGIDSVLSAMKAYSEHANVLGFAFIALAAFSNKNSEAKLLIIQKDALNMILEGMQRFESDEDIQIGGCFALGRLLRDFLPAQEIYGTKAIDAILKAMRKFKLSIKIQNNGISALAELACGHADYIVRNGGIDATVAEMRQAPFFAMSMLHGIRFLTAMSKHDSACRRILHTGAIGIVLYVMKNMANAACIQEKCCQLLCNLLQDKWTTPLIPGKDALIDGLLAAMCNHGDESHIQTLCCKSLCSLAQAPFANRCMLEHKGTVAVLSSTLEKHANDLEICAFGELIIKLLESE